MTCTRCDGALEVMQTQQMEDVSLQMRQRIERRVGAEQMWTVRRRRCVDCKQLYHTVELTLDALPVPPSPV